MMVTWILAVSLAVLSTTAAARADGLYKAAHGPYSVLQATSEWYDSARDRVVPVKTYAPDDDGGPMPVVIVSHGAGGSRDGLAYLGRHWASHGYAVVHLQHAGSDAEVWRGLSQAAAMQAIRRAVADPQAAIDRLQDVRFAVDRLLAQPLDLAGRRYAVDPQRVAVAGHSFGAFTALAAAGVTFDLPGGPVNFGDDRLIASIALSPTAFRAQQTESFSGVRIPTLHMTGTEDRGVVSDFEPSDRRRAYDLIRQAPKHLVVLEGGDHMVFSGVRRAPKSTDARHHDLTRAITTAFLDSFVNGDRAATVWLRETLPALSPGIALEEQKNPTQD